MKKQWRMPGDRHEWMTPAVRHGVEYNCLRSAECAARATGWCVCPRRLQIAKPNEPKDAFVSTGNPPRPTIGDVFRKVLEKVY
jgi:hypothetical protein